MVKHTQTIRRQQPTNCLSVFDHFVQLVLKGLRGKVQRDIAKRHWNTYQHLYYININGIESWPCFSVFLANFESFQDVYLYKI